MTIQLAKLEYCKDHGIMNQKTMSELNLSFSTKDKNGNPIFEVENITSPHLGRRTWVLERDDLTRLNKHNLTHPGETLSINEAVHLVKKDLGYDIAPSDISGIGLVPGGWLVTIRLESYRYTGSFKIKNKRGK